MEPSPPGGGGGRPARRSSKIVALILSTVTAILVAEFAVRRAFHDELDTGTLRENIREMHLGNLITPSESPDLHYLLKQGILAEWRTYLVATHPEIPIRISTIYPPPARAALKIAVLGDSTPFGWRLFAESSYPEILRVELERTLGVPVEIRNYSVPGYNSIQERALFETFIAAWKPDLLILHYDHNDPEPTTSAPPGFMPPEYGDNLLGSSIVKLAVRRLRLARSRGSRLFLDAGGAENRLFDTRYSGGPIYDLHLEALGALGASLADRKIPALALIHDPVLTRTENARESDHFRILHRPLIDHLEKAGFEILDLYPRFQELMVQRGWSDLRPLWVDKDDSHPDTQGQNFIAGVILNFLLNHPRFAGLLEKSKESPAGFPLDPGRLTSAAALQQGLRDLDEGRLDAAAASFSEARKTAPEDPVLSILMAQTFLARKMIPEAMAELEQTVRLLPEYGFAHAQLGQLYGLLGRHSEALLQFNAFLDLGPASFLDPKALSKLGDTLVANATTFDENGESEQAVETLKTASRLYRRAKREEDAVKLEQQLEARERTRHR